VAAAQVCRAAAVDGAEEWPAAANPAGECHMAVDLVVDFRQAVDFLQAVDRALDHAAPPAPVPMAVAAWAHEEAR